MANKQSGKYVHHITSILSFSDKESWEAKRSPQQRARDFSEEQLAGFSPQCLQRAPPAGGCDGRAKCQAAGVAPSGVNERRSIF